MTLRSIPPANRRPLRRLSSMRAATATGFTMVGGQSRLLTQTSQPAPADSYQPKVVRPNPQKEKQRQIFYAALHEKIVRIRELLALATEPEETLFWQRELDRLKGL